MRPRVGDMAIPSPFPRPIPADEYDALVVAFADVPPPRPGAELALAWTDLRSIMRGVAPDGELSLTRTNRAGRLLLALVTPAPPLG